jgi:hypothetical protein
MYFTYAELMSMVQLQKSRLWNKRKHQRKSAISTSKYTLKFTNGLISASITSEEQVPNGTPR